MFTNVKLSFRIEEKEKVFRSLFNLILILFDVAIYLSYVMPLKKITVFFRVTMVDFLWINLLSEIICNIFK